MSDNQDQALIRSAQAGDRRAFETLLREHYETMYKMAFKWCGNREAAEDIVQEACIKVGRNIKAFRFQASFTSWLYRIIINVGKDRHRQESRFTGLAEAGCIGDVTPNSEDRLHAEQVLEKVQTLPEREKTALLLVFGEGLTHKEVAFAMQCKESTVSGYIHQARKRLAALVDEAV